MSSSKTKEMFKNIFTADGGCRCRKIKAKEIIEPKPKGKASSTIHRSSSSSWEGGRGGGNSIDDDSSSTTYTYCSEHDHQFTIPSSSKMVSPLPKFGDSVAVVKDSNDPYQDFRQSMLQMILEKEIYSKDELQELLNCFLHLNAPSHHEVIVKAFMEIWNGVVAKRPDASNKPKNEQKFKTLLENAKHEDL